MNPYSEPERLTVMLSCCYKASQSHFSHLPMRYLISPPNHMLDAALARQVALYIFHDEFNVPRRRIVAMLGIARSTMLMAVRVIEARRADGVFDRMYHRIASRAGDLFMAELAKAAEAA